MKAGRQPLGRGSRLPRLPPSAAGGAAAAAGARPSLSSVHGPPRRKPCFLPPTALPTRGEDLSRNPHGRPLSRTTSKGRGDGHRPPQWQEGAPPRGGQTEGQQQLEACGPARPHDCRCHPEVAVDSLPPPSKRLRALRGPLGSRKTTTMIKTKSLIYSIFPGTHAPRTRRPVGNSPAPEGGLGLAGWVPGSHPLVAPIHGTL